jgi:hypothetical protein
MELEIFAIRQKPRPNVPKTIRKTKYKDTFGTGGQSPVAPPERTENHKKD